MTPLAGGCHCGAIRYLLEWPGEGAVIPARQCTCSFCTRHGARWVAHVQARLAVDLVVPQQVTAYEFGTCTARFHVCTRCGVVPVATSLIGSRLYGVVNVASFDAGHALGIEYSPVSFEGEETQGRLDRRAGAWIPDVTFGPAEAG